jgi:mannose-6-phosphate isomerase-like protein (cupin superfamily)
MTRCVAVVETESQGVRHGSVGQHGSVLAAQLGLDVRFARGQRGRHRQRRDTLADVTFKRIDELDAYSGPGGGDRQFIYAGKGLGVTAWGMNVLNLPADWADYPDHDHAKDGQEEVYVVLTGDATLHAGGQTWHLQPGTLVRVGPQQKRKIVPGGQGVTILALGATPGKAFEIKK